MERTNMYYYEVSWSDDDNYSPIIVTNEKYFNEEEFKEVTDRAVRFAFGKILDEEDNADQKYRDYIGFSSTILFDIVLDYLKDHGFERLKVDNEASYYRLYIADSNISKEDCERFKEICGEELANRIIKHNDNLHVTDSYYNLRAIEERRIKNENKKQK